MNKLHSKNKLTAVAPSFLFFFFLLAFFSRQLSLRLWRSMKAKMRIDDQPLVMRCLPISQIVASRCYRCHSHLFKFNSIERAGVVFQYLNPNTRYLKSHFESSPFERRSKKRNKTADKQTNKQRKKNGAKLAKAIRIMTHRNMKK